MRTVSKVMIILGLLIGSAFSAMADTKWTLSDVVFDNGNTATGWFLVNPTLTGYDGYSITVTGPALGATFTATIAVDAYLPVLLGFANSDFSRYLALVPATPLTNAGGTIPLVFGVDCPGCGTMLLPADGHNPEVIAATTPEPSALLLLTTGLGPAAFWLRRKLA
jgi:hypothetical protein